jgi:hypothetical protein
VLEIAYLANFRVGKVSAPKPPRNSTSRLRAERSAPSNNRPARTAQIRHGEFAVTDLLAVLSLTVSKLRPHMSVAGLIGPGKAGVSNQLQELRMRLAETLPPGDIQIIGE